MVVTLSVTLQARAARVTRANALVFELGAVQADVVPITAQTVLEYNQNW